MQTSVAATIVVISPDEKALLVRLLPALKKSACELNIRAIILDGTPIAKQQNYQLGQHVRIIHRKRRAGFAANQNTVIRSTDSEYALALNPDVAFPPGEQVVYRMAAFMHANPDCGVASCRIYHPDGSYAYPARRFPTVRAILARRAPWPYSDEKALDAHLYRDFDSASNFECDWLSGCFLFFRRKAFDQVGGFDEGYRQYFEDVDICARLRRAGWKVMHYGGTWVIHEERRASGRLFTRDAFYHGLSYARWMWKRGLKPGVEDVGW